jgi:protein-disulfide isomerase
MSSQFRQRLSVAVDVILALSALALVGWVVVRDKPPGPEVQAEATSRVVSQALWQRARELGHEVSSSSGELQIVEFLDLECAGCEVYHRTILGPLLAEDFGERTSVRVVHFPLRSHRNARAAALAAECAAVHGVLPRFVALALERQVQFAEGNWTAMALDAGVVDTSAFRACLADEKMFQRVDAGRALGDSIGVTGTPSIVVNGRLFALPPSQATLRAALVGAP